MKIVDRLTLLWIKSGHENRSLKQFLKKGGIIYSVPFLNPDGYEKYSRYNSKGIDLNRTYSQAQNRAITSEVHPFISWFEKELKQNNAQLKIAIDYHCCKSSLLLPKVLTQNSKYSRYKKIAHEMGVIFEETIKTIGFSQSILGYSPAHTAKNYWHQNHSAYSFTYEGTRQIEYLHLFKHFRFWEKIFSLAFIQ